MSSSPASTASSSPSSTTRALAAPPPALAIPSPPSSSPAAFKGASSAYVFEELNRLSNVVSQPASLSSFQQLRRSLGDDAAFVVMDYFIDIRTLHDQCTQLKAYSSDRHAAILKALLLRSERPFTVTSVSVVSPAHSDRATQLMAVCQLPLKDFLVHLPELQTTAAYSISDVRVDCMAQTFDTKKQCIKINFGGDMRSIHLGLEMYRTDDKGRRTTSSDTPVPAINTKLAMFLAMAHSYYHIYQVPHSVMKSIDLKAIFFSVANLPIALRQIALSAQDKQLLFEAGL